MQSISISSMQAMKKTKAMKNRRACLTVIKSLACFYDAVHFLFQTHLYTRAIQIQLCLKTFHHSIASRPAQVIYESNIPEQKD